MTVIADTHVHLYPTYDVPRALRTLHANLNGLAPGATPVGFLTEASGHDMFTALREGRILPGEGLCVEEARERESITIAPETRTGNEHPTSSTQHPTFNKLVLFAGRQVVTRERIEILALTLRDAVADGRTAETTVSEILDRGGVPVVSWAPGKWFFRRGAVVRDLLERFAPGELLLGDTSLRPRGWGEPRLMQAGRGRGFGVVAGSDPLPVAGEEAWLGRYASRFDGSWDADRPVESARRLLRTCAGEPARCGRRGGLVTTAWRIGRHMAGSRL